MAWMVGRPLTMANLLVVSIKVMPIKTMGINNHISW